MAITNTRKKIASLCPDSLNEVQLYAVPSDCEIDAVLRINNITNDLSTYSIYHCSAGQGDNPANISDIIAKDVYIDGLGNPPHEYSIHAGPTETIRVKSGTVSGLIFHLSGNVKKVSS